MHIYVYVCVYVHVYVYACLVLSRRPTHHPPLARIPQTPVQVAAATVAENLGFSWVSHIWCLFWCWKYLYHVSHIGAVAAALDPPQQSTW